MRNKYRGEITKDVLKWIVTAGVICIGAGSPYLIPALIKDYKRWKKYKSRQVTNAFYRLKKKGFINIKEVNHQIYISLTKEGKKMAGKYQIDDLKIEKPKTWDGKWRLIMFDIPSNCKIKREAFRGKLKEFGFYSIQKSVWVCPYPCDKEVRLLREFLGLSIKILELLQQKA